MKGILFSTPMVQAILQGRKTQTRRVIKPQPDENGVCYMPNAPLDFYGKWHPWKWDTENGETISKPPPYKIGDILYVRETWQKVRYAPAGEGTLQDLYVYKADTNSVGEYDIVKWEPSLFMPKKAARIFLQITAVRAERLQDITEEDAIAEGIEDISNGAGISFKNYINDHPMTAIGSYKSLWDSINAKKHPWDSNPWVWVYTFKKITQP